MGPHRLAGFRRQGLGSADLGWFRHTSGVWGSVWPWLGCWHQLCFRQLPAGSPTHVLWPRHGSKSRASGKVPGLPRPGPDPGTPLPLPRSTGHGQVQPEAKGRGSGVHLLLKLRHRMARADAEGGMRNAGRRSCHRHPSHSAQSASRATLSSRSSPRSHHVPNFLLAQAGLRSRFTAASSLSQWHVGASRALKGDGTVI